MILNIINIGSCDHNLHLEKPVQWLHRATSKINI